VNGVQDFTNAAKNRRHAAGGPGEGQEGGQGSGQGGSGGANPAKGGLIDPRGQIVNTNDTIPYNSKDVILLKLILYSLFASFARRVLTLVLMKKKSLTSLSTPKRLNFIRKISRRQT